MKVKFLPSGEEHEIEFNETILHLAQRKGIHIQSVCKGIPSCAECRVRIVEGEHHVLPPSSKEIALIGTAHYVDMSRLSCQLRCFGDVVVDLAEQVEKEAKALEKPKERKRSDGQESRAVLGNMFDENAEFIEAVEEELSNQKTTRGTEQRKKPNLDQKNRFYGDFLDERSKQQGRGGGQKQGQGRNRNRNRRRRGGGGQKANANQGQQK